MAARNVSLQLGLLSVPAKMHKATETKPTNTNMCQGQPGHEAHEAKPIKQPMTCTECGPVLDATTLVKGVKQGNTYAILTQEEIAEQKDKYTAQYKGAVNLIPHPADEILNATVPGDSLNYLTPAATAECRPGCKGCPTCRYHLLLRLVEAHPDIVFASLYTPVSSTALFVLRASKGVLMLEKRVRGEEMRPAPDVPAAGEVNEKLYTMLEGFLDVEPYDPEAYEDKYAAAIAELAEKADHVTVTAQGAAKAATSTPVGSDDDLMAQLQALAAGQPAYQPPDVDLGAVALTKAS